MWLSSEMLQRRQWHPTPVLLPGKSHGWRSLVGCSPWGSQESDMTEQFHFLYMTCIVCGQKFDLCKFIQMLLLSISSCFLCLDYHFGRNGKSCRPAVDIYHIFNGIPTTCYSNKEGDSLMMWLRVLALGSECQCSNPSFFTY